MSKIHLVIASAVSALALTLTGCSGSAPATSSSSGQREGCAPVTREGGWRRSARLSEAPVLRLIGH
jgi:hypothetical protein